MARTRKASTVENESKAGIVIPSVMSVPAGQLNPAPYNPRRIKPAQLASLKLGIRTHGFLEPVVVQREGLVLIGGHQRVRAVKEICVEDGLPLPKLPAVVLDVDDRTAKRINVALNRVGGDFDMKLLADVLAGLDKEATLTEDDRALMGFTDDEAAKLLSLVEPPTVPEGDDLSSFGRSVTLSLQFADTKRRDAVKDLLKKRAEAMNVSSGDVVFALLGGKP